MAKNDLVKQLEAGEIDVKHGDYQRIANVTVNPKGKPYTADYVRKVLMGVRKQPAIIRIADAYFKKLAKVDREMMKLSEETDWKASYTQAPKTQSKKSLNDS